MVQSNTVTVVVSPAYVINPVISASWTQSANQLVVSGTGFTPSSTASLSISPSLLGFTNGSVSTTSNGQISTFTIYPGTLPTTTTTYTISATDTTTGKGASTTFTITIAEKAGGITISESAGAITVGGQDIIYGNLVDQNGSPLANYTVTLTDSTTGGTMTATTASNGSYQFMVTFSTAGTYTLYTSAS